MRETELGKRGAGLEILVQASGDKTQGPERSVSSLRSPSKVRAEPSLNLRSQDTWSGCFPCVRADSISALEGRRMPLFPSENSPHALLPPVLEAPIPTPPPQFRGLRSCSRWFQS